MLSAYLLCASWSPAQEERRPSAPTRDASTHISASAVAPSAVAPTLTQGSQVPGSGDRSNSSSPAPPAVMSGVSESHGYVTLGEPTPSDATASDGTRVWASIDAVTAWVRGMHL